MAFLPTSDACFCFSLLDSRRGAGHALAGLGSLRACRSALRAGACGRIVSPGGAEPADATRTLVYYVYDQAFAELEISYACTVGLALFVIVLLLSAVRFAFAGDRGLT